MVDSSGDKDSKKWPKFRTKYKDQGCEARAPGSTVNYFLLISITVLLLGITCILTTCKYSIIRYYSYDKTNEKHRHLNDQLLPFYVIPHSLKQPNLPPNNSPGGQRMRPNAVDDIQVPLGVLKNSWQFPSQCIPHPPGGYVERASPCGLLTAGTKPWCVRIQLQPTLLVNVILQHFHPL